jgi:hypothetical protein
MFYGNLMGRVYRLQYTLNQERNGELRMCTKVMFKAKAVPLHAMEELWGRGGIAPTHS